MDTNYTSAFILVSPDTQAEHGTAPPKLESVAGHQHALLTAAPYRFTSDELLFEVHVRRNKIEAGDRDAAWQVFSRKSHACLRASPLVKTYGWGIHHDAESRVALIAMESDQYRELQSRADLDIRPGMRSRKTR